MDTKNLIEQFNKTIDLWIDQLNFYDYHQLCLQSNADNWSLGQVYEHLIADTKYYFQQVKECQTHNENAVENMADNAKEWFQNNSFPNIKMVGPPDNEMPPIPVSKKQLLEDLTKLKFIMNEIGIEISKTSYKGKTKHPAFGYFNSAEWFQYAEMHFRHHLRQKERIDAFLKSASFGNT